MKRSGASLVFLGLLMSASACTPLGPEEQSTTDSLKDAPLPKAVRLREPIVLAHGFNASPNSIHTFSDRIVRQLQALGTEVVIARLNPYADSETRGIELLDAIRLAQLRTGAKKVHVIAHSQAGLDGRFAASPAGLDAGDSIRSITTISTPHRGTAIADYALRFGGWLNGFLASDLDEQARQTCANGGCDLNAALVELQEKGFAARFNDRYPDAAGVVYQSVAGVSTMSYGPVDGTSCRVAEGEALSPESMERLRRGAADDMNGPLEFSSKIVGHYAEEPNDGVVLVESAKWGRFRGCVLADHSGVIDQGNYPGGADPNNGLDVSSFYTRLVADLAKLE